jgi:signal transduction histidine kinase/CheY-like chemotaxis protein
MGPDVEYGVQHRLQRPTTLISLIGCLGILVICAATAWMILQLRASELQNAGRELKALDLILVEDSERALQSVDLVLRNMQETVASEQVETLEQFRALHGTQDISQLLRMRIAGIPQISALVLVDAEGQIISQSTSRPGSSANVSDRDYFKALRDAPKDAFYLSEPLQEPGIPQQTIYLARRIEAENGQFLGLVICAIKLSQFENLYKTLQIGDGTMVSLWRKDGTLLVSYPPVKDQTRVLRSQNFEQRLRAQTPQVLEVEKSFIDGRARIVSTVAGKQFPIVVDVGQDTSAVLRDWRHISSLIIAAAMLGITAVLAIVWLLRRQFAAFEALHVAVSGRERSEAARMEVEAQLRQAQKLEAVGELTGGIAHDFNNLLTAVIGNLDLLSRHAEAADPRLQRWAKSALEAAKRGATLTQRLLAFSRRQPLDPKATDIVALLHSMSDLLSRTLGENIKIGTDLPDALWLAFVDVNQLDSAILNIAINARDAMEGHGDLAIEARNETIATGAAAYLPPGDYVVIAVRDTGKGIPKNVLDRVFEPFFTTKPIGQGTGLGLSQVYGFLKQTGGQILIDSVVGKGTTVKMYLPRARAEEPPQQEPEERPHGETAEAASTAVATGAILVVEDDEAVRAYSVETLTGLGYKVLEAGDGAQALAILRRDQSVTLLFTDVGLPGMDGSELAMRAARAWPHLRILFTSGYARQAIMHNDRLDEGVELLVKPFTREELAKKIACVLAQSPNSRPQMQPFLRISL